MDDLGDFIGAMITFSFLVVFMWVIITMFIDIWARDDLSGWAKAGWILLLIIFPLVGALVYIVTRPKPTEEEILRRVEHDKQFRQQMGYSTAAELEKLAELREKQVISNEEFAKIKSRLV